MLFAKIVALMSNSSTQHQTRVENLKGGASIKCFCSLATWLFYSAQPTHGPFTLAKIVGKNVGDIKT
jgi:hypothetical protein